MSCPLFGGQVNGWERSEERDANNQVTKRFYGQSEQLAGNSYFYTRDHLGSIRELTDSAGVVRARYDYESWGRRSANIITVNPVEANFAFTGHYVSTQYPGLAFAPLRVYSTDFGRWLSRDPIGERGGLNLYGYTSNNPANWVDPLGLTLSQSINMFFDWLSGSAPASQG